MENFYKLEEGIVTVCKADYTKPMKAGLKVAIASLIRMRANCLIADIIRKKTEEAEEVDCRRGRVVSA